MTTPTAELLFTEQDATPFSTEESTVKPWDLARECVEAAPKALLSTVRPNGAPHTAPVLPVWAAGQPGFVSRPGSRKSRNVAENPRAVFTVAGETVDLVVEGEVTRVRDEAGVRRLADAFTAKYGWRLAIRDGRAFEDSLPGSPEYAFYSVRPTRAFGYGVDGQTATRWRF